MTHVFSKCSINLSPFLFSLFLFCFLFNFFRRDLRIIAVVRAPCTEKDHRAPTEMDNHVDSSCLEEDTWTPVLCRKEKRSQRKWLWSVRFQFCQEMCCASRLDPVHFIRFETISLPHKISTDAKWHAFVRSTLGVKTRIQWLQENCELNDVPSLVSLFCEHFCEHCGFPRNHKPEEDCCIAAANSST